MVRQSYLFAAIWLLLEAVSGDLAQYVTRILILGNAFMLYRRLARSNALLLNRIDLLLIDNVLNVEGELIDQVLSALSRLRPLFTF